ncbi:hypothetical protein KSC_044770 [Ktedonobacter sp. SOSP1-52]|nr:hypothetical protein KSC_044770 [Ktedonobacter sp. SOSP1-52]
MYHQGCLALCSEINPNRLAAHRTGTLTPEERMAVAARIAAIMVFTNTSAVWKSQDQSDMSEADLGIHELDGSKEKAKGKQFPVTLAGIEEVLDTGLFTSRGLSRIGWVHKTYAEYLAAHYLVQHQVNLLQVTSLIIHPDDPERKIVPQLYETTAWLAAMQPDLFRELLKKDPNVLLSSAVIATDEQGRMDFVAALLQLGDEECTLALSRHSRQLYAKLTHPQLEQQLRPYLRDQTQTLPTRLLAIHIAEACEVRSLQQDLATVALDSSEPPSIREGAAHAVVHIGDATIKVQLKLLLQQSQEDDGNDQLKGYGLQAAWPEHMTLPELLNVLTQPQKENFFGAYQYFLISLASHKFRATDLPVALVWTEQHQNTDPGIPSQDALSTFRDAIMIQSWDHLDMPEVLHGFSRTLFVSFKHYHPWLETHENNDVFLTRVRQEHQKRRRVLVSLFHLMLDGQSDSIELLSCRPPLVFEQDVYWLLDIFGRTNEFKEIQPVMAQLLWRIADINNTEQTEALLFACERTPILAAAFAPLLLPVDLNSPEAQHMKEEYQRSQKWQAIKDAQEQRTTSTPRERISSLLQDCELTDIALWQQLIYELTYRPDGSPYQDPWDRKTFPGWNEVDLPLQKQLLETATTYLHQHVPAHKWREDSELPYEAWAIYKSLQLLCQETPQVIFLFPLSVWQRVLPAFLWLSDPHTVTIDYKLLTIAHNMASTTVVESILLLIDVKDKRGEQIDILSKIELCWGDELAQALLEKAQDQSMSLENLGLLLRTLLTHQMMQAQALATSLIPVPLPNDQERRAKALVAAHALLTSAQDAGWSHLWPLLQTDADFGQQLLSRGISNPNFAGMTEHQVADLYIWLVRQRSPKNDSTQVAGFVTTADRLSMLRNTILTYLQRRGTFIACEAIHYIMQELPEPAPDLPYMPWVLREAQIIARQSTWIPLRAEELLQVIRSQETRLVHNGDHLLDVLIESLQRLEAKLQGETPAAIDLWNDPTDKQAKKRIYTPKDENQFSDYVKRHLDEDLVRRGVIANREVELRSGTGSSAGERTDIHVDALVRQSSSFQEVYDVITVIIEVKGCWHKELKQAMQTQLVDRYLKENRSCQHGLYLVGWFLCEQWDETVDYRKKQSPKFSLNEARRFFLQQSEALSQADIQVKAYVMNTALR